MKKTNKTGKCSMVFYFIYSFFIALLFCFFSILHYYLFIYFCFFLIFLIFKKISFVQFPFVFHFIFLSESKVSLVTNQLHLERINTYLFFLVLYSYICNRSRIQTNYLKPKILFLWRLEYIWFHHCSLISTRIRIRRCSRSFSSQVFSFGK